MDKLLNQIHQNLGITQTHLESHRLERQDQPALHLLEVVDIDFEGKPFLLISPAAKAWREMVSFARTENIYLMPFSGFRSYIHQKNIIEKHLKNGRRLEDIFTHIAIPGFSEHHSGRAVDIHADSQAVLEEAFESTEEFRWLSENAGRYNFRLSYPRSNSQGIIYEPWHWFYIGK